MGETGHRDSMARWAGGESGIGVGGSGSRVCGCSGRVAVADGWRRGVGCGRRSSGVSSGRCMWAGGDVGASGRSCCGRGHGCSVGIIIEAVHGMPRSYGSAVRRRRSDYFPMLTELKKAAALQVAGASCKAKVIDVQAKAERNWYLTTSQAGQCTSCLTSAWEWRAWHRHNGRIRWP